ncbi:Sulfate adenylyltransferase subunit 2 [Mycolicibacterium aubagnense]
MSTTSNAAPVAALAPIHVDELRLLEAEAVHIIREVVAELERPVLLFSAGKDSIVLLRLAEKAFRPATVALSGAARRHRPQLPRGHRFP